MLVGHVSIQICSLLLPVRLGPPCRRPILIATTYLVFRGQDTRSSERPHTTEVKGWCVKQVLRGEGSGDASPANSGVTSKSKSKTRRLIMPDYFTLLRDRVTLKCRSIDRIFLQAYVPKLQTVGQVCTFLRWQRRFQSLPRPPSVRLGMAI